MRIPFLKPKLTAVAYNDLWDGTSRDMLEQLMLLRVLLDETFSHSFALPEPSLLRAEKTGKLRMEMRHPTLEYPVLAFECELLAGDRVGYHGVSFLFRIEGQEREWVGEYSTATLKQQGFTHDLAILRGWIKQLPLLNIASLAMTYLARSGVEVVQPIPVQA